MEDDYAVVGICGLRLWVAKGETLVVMAFLVGGGVKKGGGFWWPFLGGFGLGSKWWRSW